MIFDTRNDVLMDGNKYASVTFEQNVTITVPSDYTDIQTAIEHARDGDIVKISQGTYYGGGIVIDKDIIVTSTNPDDPLIVANTIIDCSGEGGASYVNIGVIFGPNANAGAVLNGLTIING